MKIYFFLLLWLVIGTMQNLMKNINPRKYTVYYNGDCNIFKWCPKNYFCKSNKCLEYRNGEISSFCSIIQFKFCQSNLICKNNICVDSTTDDVVIFYVKKNNTELN